MEEIKTTYKGMDIFYDSWDKWSIECDYGKYTNEKLSFVKTWIDRKIKQQFKRYEVIVSTYYGYSTGIVTSEIGKNEVWVKFDDKSREKIEKKKIMIKTPERMEIVKQIEDIKIKMMEYSNLKKDEIAKLERQLFDR